MQPRPPASAYAAAVAMPFAFGVSFVATKYALRGFEPLFIALLRFTLAGAILWVLLRLRRAYTLEDQGDAFTSSKQPAQAAQAYAEAMKLAPDVVELQFWAAVTMYANGQEPAARKLFRGVFAREPRWSPLVPRLAKVGLFPDDPKKIADVLAQEPRGRLSR